MSCLTRAAPCRERKKDWRHASASVNLSFLTLMGIAFTIMHNAARAYTSPFEYYLERLFNDIHSDFHWSTDFRSQLETICELKFSLPERFTSHRFLSTYNLAVDTSRRLDAYLVFYYNILTKNERQHK